MKKNFNKKKTNPIVYKVAISCLVVCILAVGAFAWKTTKTLKRKCQEDTTALQAQISSMQRTGYVAATDIKMGDMITEDMLTYKSDIACGVDQSLLITAADLGKVAVVDIPTGVPVYTSSVSEELAANYTERECNFIYLNANLADGDYVDVRIMFPNGEDYIVASKKCLKTPVIANNSCYLWLTEDENDLLSAAIVDANLNKAKIYVNRYVNPSVEDASIVTYNPNEDVINAMKVNPNIVAESEAALSIDARQNLEGHLDAFLKEYPDYVIDDQIVDDASKQDAGADSSASGSTDSSVVNNDTSLDSGSMSTGGEKPTGTSDDTSSSSTNSGSISGSTSSTVNATSGSGSSTNSGAIGGSSSGSSSSNSGGLNYVE